MARPFSYPEVQQLEVGQSCVVFAPEPEVKRKVVPYAARKAKRFSFTDEATPFHGRFCEVTRLPDPEPEVA